MPLLSFEGKRPTTHPTAFIAPTAVLVGDVTIEENASVWYNAWSATAPPSSPAPGSAPAP